MRRQQAAEHANALSSAHICAQEHLPYVSRARDPKVARSVCLHADVALDPYSSMGHDGIVEDGKILNDETIEQLCKQVVCQVSATCPPNGLAACTRSAASFIMPGAAAPELPSSSHHERHTPRKRTRADTPKRPQAAALAHRQRVLCCRALTPSAAAP
eukprot:6178077-Pleurochrysis_carterae.AAC.4